MTGIVQFIGKHGLDNFKVWCEDGYSFLKKYDKDISKVLKIAESIKITSIKPSGTVSLLGGATPGIIVNYFYSLLFSYFNSLSFIRHSLSS